MSVTPIDLFASAIALDGSGHVHAAAQGVEAEAGEWRLTAVHAKTDEDVHPGGWQVHAEADELVSCVVGKIRIRLSPEQSGQDEEVIRLTAGKAAVVPRGRSHRISPDIPSVVLAATLPSGDGARPRPEAVASHG